MATGVIATDLNDVHLLLASTIMFGFAAAVWLLLAVVLGKPFDLSARPVPALPEQDRPGSAGIDFSRQTVLARRCREPLGRMRERVKERNHGH